MSPEKREVYDKKMALRNEIVESIIRLTNEGKINWDFSHFDNSFFGQEARGEYKGVTFVCCDWQDTGAEFNIITREKVRNEITKEKKEVTKVVDSLRGRKARRLRSLLGELASEDPILQQIRKQEKARLKISEEERRKRKEEDTKKLGEIVQLFQAQS